MKYYCQYLNCHKKLPISLLKNPKKGFSIPIGDWFKGNDFQDKVNTKGLYIPQQDIFRKSATAPL